jgi:hypothetical protein
VGETQEKVYARFFEMADNLKAAFEKQQDLSEKLERHQKMVSRMDREYLLHTNHGTDTAPSSRSSMPGC